MSCLNCVDLQQEILRITAQNKLLAEKLAKEKETTTQLIAEKNQYLMDKAWDDDSLNTYKSNYESLQQRNAELEQRYKNSCCGKVRQSLKARIAELDAKIDSTHDDLTTKIDWVYDDLIATIRGK
jgi:uncharacterized protein (DUF3084 family)